MFEYQLENMTTEEKKKEVFEWLEQKKGLITVASLASISNVNVHSLYKAIEYQYPLKAEYIDRLHEGMLKIKKEI